MPDEEYIMREAKRRQLAFLRLQSSENFENEEPAQGRKFSAYFADDIRGKAKPYGGAPMRKLIP